MLKSTRKHITVPATTNNMMLMMNGAKHRSSFSQSANYSTSTTIRQSQGPSHISVNWRHFPGNLEYCTTVVVAHIASTTLHNCAACMAGLLSSCSSWSTTMWQRAFAITLEYLNLSGGEIGGPSKGGR